MIQFSGTNQQRIDYGNTAITAPELMTLSLWVNLTDVTTTTRILQQYYTATIPPAPTSRSYGLSVSGGTLIFQALCTDSPFAGSWTAPISTGLNHIVIQMNFQSVANNPVVFINGASVTVTETTTPAGTFPSGSTNTIFSIGDISGAGDATVPFTGTVVGLQIFNRILVVSEMETLYQSRKFSPISGGLVFSPTLINPAGSLGDGDTLTTSNTMRDVISGLTGTPQGSPVYKDNNILSLGGE